MDIKHRQPDHARATIQAFYDQHPYPPPVADLDSYQQRWQDEGRRRTDFHLHWPGKAYRSGLNVLVAGCGTSQAVKHALRQPADRVIGIDISATSIRHSETLKQKYKLSNLELFQLPVERLSEMGRCFDKIVCTGVLHHLPDPLEGLRALREALEPDGVLHLMVYAAYGRAGVTMLQEYCRRLGIGLTDKEINDLAHTLTALPAHHPLARLLADTPDFRRRDALADALLNPLERVYTVPQVFDLVASCGLSFNRWVRQAPYLPQCGSLKTTPHAARLAKLPLREQFAAMELFRGNMLRHNLILCRDDRQAGGDFPRFSGDSWMSYVPHRLPDTVSLHHHLPAGAAAVLINQAHSDPDLVLPIDAHEMRLVTAIDGKHSVGEIIQSVSQSSNKWREKARSLFERLYWYDQVVWDASA